MLVLISFGLVLVATVLLVFGLIADDGLALIYISIACSLAAGIILVIATRVNRPRQETVKAAPTPLPAPEPVAPAVPATPSAPAVVEEPVAVDTSDDDVFAPATAPVAAVAAPVDDDLFPIADYDDLSVGEIVPLLPKLYADEMDIVAAREESGKARRQILSKLDELKASMVGAPDDLTAEEWAAEQGEPAATTAAAAPAKKASPAKKAAAPAKKTAAKKAAPAKKAAAKKAAPAKKAAAPAKKAAAKKAAPAKKAAAKKAAPAKKTATKATKATKKR